VCSNGVAGLFKNSTFNFLENIHIVFIMIYQFTCLSTVYKDSLFRTFTNICYFLPF
jgi:hypothetical protein